MLMTGPQQSSPVADPILYSARSSVDMTCAILETSVRLNVACMPGGEGNLVEQRSVPSDAATQVRLHSPCAQFSTDWMQLVPQ